MDAIQSRVKPDPTHFQGDPPGASLKETCTVLGSLFNGFRVKVKHAVFPKTLPGKAWPKKVRNKIADRHGKHVGLTTKHFASATLVGCGGG